jgi:cardiolipin synthase
MNRLHSPNFQRIAGLLFIILLQLVAFVVVIDRFTSYFIYFYWICVIISLFVSVWIANGKSKLPYKVAWIIPILMFPLLGGLAFFLMGGSRTPSRRFLHHTRDIFRHQLISSTSPADLEPLGIDVVQQSQYLYHVALCPLYSNTETRYFPNGESFFPVFLDELSKATKYIFLEYFIISEGTMWSQVLEILTKKAAQGVDVRVIYDDFGSLISLPKSFPEDLAKVGILCSVFQPVRPVLSVHQNNRDHRKLCVIDGIVGFTGGINLADEYINQIERFGYWKDSALLIRGEAVWSLTVMFLHMWESIRHASIEYSRFRPESYAAMPQHTGFVQPYFDTPLATDTICADLHLQMFAKAKNYLYITTPYLVIDETIASVLHISARSGVDVRIMTPHIPDKKMVFSVTQSHYESLLKAGVRIYEFLPGFIHSKTVVADDLYASIGSCNLDYRSFYLQQENGAWLCGTPSVLAIREDFITSLSFCKEITLEDCQSIPFFTRLARSVLRMFSPLL